MKAVVIEQYGGKDELVEKEVASPTPDKNQVVVTSYATSINPIDWKLREGYLKEMLPFNFPIILGWDIAGVIKEVGSSVEGFKEGDRVFARPATTANGTYAEEVVVDDHLLAHIPDRISYEEAASVPLVGLTAWQCLIDFADIQKGEKVLIHAGAGGVGSFAIQLAKYKGAYVATTASGKNEEYLKSLGADKVINYREHDFSEELEEYDVVLDTMGGDIQEKSFNVLRGGGRLVSIVGEPDQEKAKEKGVRSGNVWLEPNGEQLKEIASLMENGHIKATIGHRFPFSQEGIQEAHELSESHHAKGKIVINFNK
ncbi:NADP-dependent oxidoreductase [Bacillus sp. es.036]|uniref:NADP-dependent oxidoreductase n=1 Tax=Bacillus sp. es.036 TaxID=1761764 RepID=UPI000BF4D313|nr:NADP-dependent oxidoreductase [Bacillus sp. es.036]PFG13417.1 NADPH:quinone reductase-like Zn-dependent oxidoreductase [Bacillus sp. es.036]